MPRKPDMTNIRIRTIWRNGKPVDVYQVRIRLQDDCGVLRTLTQTFDNLADAQTWRDKKKSQVRLGEIGDRREQNRELRNTTLGELIRRYRGELSHAHARICVEYITGASRRFLSRLSCPNEFIILGAFLNREANGLCKKALADLKQRDFLEYRDRRLFEDKRSPATLRREISALRPCLKHARKDLYLPVDESVLRDLEIPKEGHKERTLKPDERARLYKAIETQCRGRHRQKLWVSFVIAALTSAMRRGELCKLEWQDIDFDKGTIYLREEITKSKWPRLLPMTGELQRALMTHRDNIKATKPSAKNDLKPLNLKSSIFWGIGKKDQTGSRVFPLTQSAATQMFTRLCKHAGINTDETPKHERLTIHSLRHTAATNFANPKTVNLSGSETAYMLGQKYPGMPRTTRIYVNPDILEMVESIRAKIEAADRRATGGDVSLDEFARLRHFINDADNDHPSEHVSSPIPWPDWQWKEKIGRVVIDVDHPKTIETLTKTRQAKRDASRLKQNLAANSLLDPDILSGKRVLTAGEAAWLARQLRALLETGPAKSLSKSSLD